MAAGLHADCVSPFSRIQEVRDVVLRLQDRMLTVSCLSPAYREYVILSNGSKTAC
jgi:hypothetical protein